jgi:hypothetical protein
MTARIDAEGGETAAHSSVLEREVRDIVVDFLARFKRRLQAVAQAACTGLQAPGSFTRNPSVDAGRQL